MDINSLLSPSDAPVKPANAAQASASPRRKPARPTGGKRTSSTLSQEITLHSPPPDGPPRSVPNLGYDSIAQAQRNSLSSPSFVATADVRTPLSNLNTPLSEMRSPFGSPQVQRPQPQYFSGRTSSNPQMETLAGEITPSREIECELTYDTLADLANMQQQQQPQPRHGSIVEAQRSPSM